MMKKGEKRKIAIVEKAIELFNLQGFHNVTFQLIADELEITQPNIFYYFKTKNNLLQGCIEYIVENNKRVSTPQPDIGDKSDQLKFLCKGTLDWAIQFPAQPHLILFLNYNAKFDETFREIQWKLINNGVERVLSILGKKNKESREIAKSLQRYCYGAIFQIISADDPTQVYNECLSEVLRMIRNFNFEDKG